MKDIPGYESLYAATEDGRIWSYKRKRFLKPFDNGNGYLIVDLRKDGKRKHCRVHRLVAATYLPNPNNLPQVNHIDEDRTNNALSNLEYCDAAYNINYSQAKKVICIETGVVYNSIKEAAEKNNLFDTSISAVCKGKRKTAGGYHWKYYD